MVSKSYRWVEGARLDDYSRRKHKILREYLFQYLLVRCANPRQPKFRIAIVDGFSGGGRYACGSPGSPIIFIEELQRAVITANAKRADQGLKSNLEIDCLLILNDAKKEIVEILKSNVETTASEASELCPNLKLNIVYLNDKFVCSYKNIKDIIVKSRYKNVLFNLDQYGYSAVDNLTIHEIMKSTLSVEIFYTFSIESLITFLNKTNKNLLDSQIKTLGISHADLLKNSDMMSNNAFLGAAERIVFNVFQNAAPFVSPFSIRNPDGWRYWLIHLANSFRARQVYNDVLHGNGTQAHFGRSGLNMLSYDPSHDRDLLYLFEHDNRKSAKEQLIEDIPRFISNAGGTMKVFNFYEATYNITPRPQRRQSYRDD